MAASRPVACAVRVAARPSRASRLSRRVESATQPRDHTVDGCGQESLPEGMHGPAGATRPQQ